MTADGCPKWGEPPRIMGVLNATPDSFSGDGLAGQVAALVERGLAQVAAGAAILDVGGESSRPGSAPVSVEEEARRALPLVEQLVQRTDVPVSIDTAKPEIAEAALAAGARVLNDVSGLRDPRLAVVAARYPAWLVVTHNGWTLGEDHGRAEDVVDDVVGVLRRLAEQAIAAGVAEERVIVDPGLGFGKAPPESLGLLRRTAELHERLAPFPLLIGPSRKGFIGAALGLPVDQRLEGTLACVAIAALGGAEIIRVHDIAPAVRAARMGWAVRTAQC